MQTLDLFSDPASGQPEPMGPRAFLLRGFALPRVDQLLPAIAGVAEAEEWNAKRKVVEDKSKSSPRPQ